jgi:hypothetical protein
LIEDAVGERRTRRLLEYQLWQVRPALGEHRCQLVRFRGGRKRDAPRRTGRAARLVVRRRLLAGGVVIVGWVRQVRVVVGRWRESGEHRGSQRLADQALGVGPGCRAQPSWVVQDNGLVRRDHSQPDGRSVTWLR